MNIEVDKRLRNGRDIANILIKKLAYDFLLLSESSIWAFSRIGF